MIPLQQHPNNIKSKCIINPQGGINNMELANPKELVQSALSLFKLIQRHEDLNLQISELDKEIVDINHFIEFKSNADLQGGYKAYKELRDVRRKRRDVKNELEKLNPVVDLCKDFPEFKNKLKQVYDGIVITENRQSIREYSPRVRHDLFPEKECIKVESKPSLESMIRNVRKDYKQKKRGRC
jgi:hypothetical protein